MGAGRRDVHGYPHGIIGFADLASPKLVETLDAQSRCRNFRGIRHACCIGTKPCLFDSLAHSHVMGDRAWRRGLAVLGSAVCFSSCRSLLRNGRRGAPDRRFPRITFILLHAGCSKTPVPKAGAPGVPE
jgi:hypothetical protein